MPEIALDFSVDSGESDDTPYSDVSDGQRRCACGCGTILPPDYKWAYKRGHKLAALARGESPDEDRPESDGISKVITSTRVSKKMRDDIQGQIVLILGMAGGMFAMNDPVCGGSLVENLDLISEKLVPIICKSPTAVRFMTRGGGMLDYLALAAALRPVVTTVWKHHITHSIHDDSSALSNVLYEV